MHINTIYIIPNNINSAIRFSNFTNNYLRYWNIDINI